MIQSFTRLRMSVGVALLAQTLSLGSALAVPSYEEAWSSIEHNIHVYKDADPASSTYWFVPKIRFETSAGKTVLRPKTLPNGKVEYTTRIIPYFSADFRELVIQNIPSIRQQSQLKPVVAKSIGISLPDFAYKFSSPSVTNYQYLDVPRLVRFQLDPDEAATFDSLYGDELGVPVEFTIAYDGTLTDKFYRVQITCKEMDRELSTNFKSSAGVQNKKVYLGADLQFAFLNSVQNSVNGVNITSKGDIAGMQEMLRRVMGVCFQPVDGYYDDYEYDRRRTDDDIVYPSRRVTDRGDPVDDGFTPRTQFASLGMVNRSEAAMKLAAQEAKLMKDLYDRIDLDRVARTDCDPKKDKNCEETNPNMPTRKGDDTDLPSRTGEDDPGLLPPAQLKARYVFKKTALDKNNQAIVNQVELKDAITTSTAVEILSANAKPIEKVTSQPIAEKKFTVGVKNPATAPVRTGITVAAGDQLTITAEFTFNAVSGYSPWKAKQFNWDATWEKTDGDLYYRVGNGDWAPVNRRAGIASDAVNGGGELQFYLDRAAIFDKIPEKLRKGNILVGPAFTIEGIAPVFSVQVSGRRVSVK